MPRTLFHSRDAEILAAQIVSGLEKTVMSQIFWRSDGPEGDDPVVFDEAGIADSDVVFLADFGSPDHVFEQLAVIRELPRYGARSLTVLVTDFPIGPKNEAGHPGRVSLVDHLAELLATVPSCGNGRRPDIHVWDVHDHKTKERFRKSGLIARFPLAAHRSLCERLTSAGVDAVAFPDVGSFNRFRRAFPEFEHIVIERMGDGVEQFQAVKMNDPAGKHVVVLNDRAIDRKFSDAARALTDWGAKTVSAVVTHPKADDNGLEEFSRDLFSRVWVTDANSAAAEKVRGRAPFEVVSIAPQIRDLLNRNA